MIEQIKFTGAVVNAARRRVPGLGVGLQIFVLKKGWQTIGETETDLSGGFRGTAKFSALGESTVAPQLRCIDLRSGSEIGAKAVPHMVRDVLEADFGTVVLSALGEDDSLSQGATEEIIRLKTKLLSVELEKVDVSGQLEAKTNALVETAAERDDFKLQLEQIRDSDGNSPLITDLASQVASSLGNANPQIATGGFQLGEAKITLKGHLTDGGNRFRPLDIAQAAGPTGAAASEISFNLRSPAIAEASTATMPDLIGFTPTTARMVMQALGVSVRVVERAGAPVGAVMKHHPEAGADLETQAIVMLEVAVAPTEA